jgi:hypothetical protein
VTGALAIGRVRIRGDAEDDGLRLRLGVDRLLGGLSAAPARLPPAAILVVRALRDPLPGRVDVRAATLPPRWDRAVSAALDDHVARAARPALGVPAVEEGAVLFADRAELLACLASDAIAGAVAARWWWRALGLRWTPDVVAAFADTPEHVPAALALLDAGVPAMPGGGGPRAVCAFVAPLPAPAAARISARVARAFGVDAVVAAATGAPADPESADAPATAAAAAPPWADLLDAPSLAPEQELLAGLSLMLARAPATVRSPEFARAVAAWAAARDETPAATGTHVDAPQRVPPPRPATAAQGRPPLDAPGASAPATGDAHGRARPAQPASLRSAQPRAPAPRARPARRAAPPHERATQHPARASATAPPAARATDALADAVSTAYGGLFHLVYLAQRLGLYGDFANPAQPGLRLHPWDFVALVGHRLLGRPRRGDDPVWALLADLARRPRHVAPGRGLRPPPAWRVPRSWLEPFEGVRGAWRAGEDASGRVRLVHPSGFVVVDARGMLARELARYGVHAARLDARGRAPADDRTRWCAYMAAYVRARLALGLGVPPADAVRATLVRPASIAVTAAHVDVTSELAELPIEVRLAGLDRDPGFIPAAGRALRLHFT